MSVRNISSTPSRNLNITLGSRNLVDSSYVTEETIVDDWVRNASWPACEANTGDNKIVGLYAVFPGDGSGNGSNFFAATISGDYTINYGDGTTANYNSSSIVYYEFNYNNSALDGTNAPVTLNATDDKIERTNHGYSNNTIIQLYNIASTTGITERADYYVINATTNDFQISETSGGSALTFTTNGTATLLPYKIAVVTITPQAGQSLTSVNFNVRHSSLSTSPGSGWLDIAVACSTLATLTLGGATTNVQHGYVERLRLNQTTSSAINFSYLCANMSSLRSVYIDNSITPNNLSSMFSGCASLKTVPLFNTASVTNVSSMFTNCYSLIEVPLFNTASVTSMSQMFNGCYSLKKVPLFNTNAVTTMASMFINCNTLTTVPLFNTANVNNMSSMFNGCASLKTVPLFNTIKVTTFSSMFLNCYNLQEVPLFNTVAATAMSGMFQYCHNLKKVPLFNTANNQSMSTMFQACYNLEEIPLFNTINLTNMGSTFNGCSRLKSVPLLNTSNVTIMSSTFAACSSLKTVPLFNTAKVTDMSSMFASCNSLQSVPLFDTANVTLMTSTFSSCYSLTSIPKFNTSKVTAMNSTFISCYNLTGVSPIDTANVTNMNSTFSGCAKLKTIPTFNTSKVTNPQFLFQNCSLLQEVPSLNFNAVTVASNFVSVFSGCTSLSRMSANGFNYSISVANCKLSANALNEIYTNLPTVVGQTITVTGNYGTTSDDPTIATGKGWTVTG